jgi:hypothetical protein
VATAPARGLEQDDAEEHGQRPGLRHRERTPGLEFLDEAGDRLRLDVGRAGRHDLPGQRVGQRKPAELTAGAAREPVLEGGRKLLANQADGPLDDVI